MFSSLLGSERLSATPVDSCCCSLGWRGMFPQHLGCCFGANYLGEGEGTVQPVILCWASRSFLLPKKKKCRPSWGFQKCVCTICEYTYVYTSAFVHMYRCIHACALVYVCVCEPWVVREMEEEPK